MKSNRRQTLKDLTARFNKRTGCNVSHRTVHRRLCFGGYKRRMICKKITIACHVSLRANQCKEENGIRTLLWPPQSPGLNIIENVWKVLKIQVQRRHREIKNGDYLRRVALDIYTGLGLYYIRCMTVYMTVFLGGSGVF